MRRCVQTCNWYFLDLNNCSKNKTIDPHPPSQFSSSFGQVGQTATPTTPLQTTHSEQGETVSSPPSSRHPSHILYNPLSARHLCRVPASQWTQNERTGGPTTGPAVPGPLTALGLTFPHSRELCSSDILEQLRSSAYNAAVMVRGKTEREGSGKKKNENNFLCACAPACYDQSLPSTLTEAPHPLILNPFTEQACVYISFTPQFIFPQSLSLFFLLYYTFIFYLNAIIIIFPFCLVPTETIS